MPLLRGGHAKSRRPKDISSLDDGVSDHPVWTLNFLALANALAGYVYLPGETPTAQDSDLIYPGSAGDTDYYVIDSGIVPILRPLASLGVPHFLLSAPEAAEPDAPQVDSPGKAAPSAEPVAAEASAGTRKSNDAKTVSAQTDTTPTSVPEPKVRPTAAGTKPKPPAKQPDRPKVRGPIEFDLQKTPAESPSSASEELSATSETSATETNSKTASDSTNSPGSENKDAA